MPREMNKSQSMSAESSETKAMRACKLMYGDVSAEYSGESKRIKKNKDVILAGKQYRGLFINQDGWLFRYKNLRNGNRQIMDFVLPGQIFGLQAYLFQAALFSVAAITDATVLYVPLDTIDHVFERTPSFAKALFWSAVCEAAITGEHLINAACRSAYERVSHLLLELFVRLRSVDLTDGMSFSMPLTQEHIGSALGLTNVHVNRTLRSLRDDNLIAIDGSRITILDFESLVLLSNFDHSYLAETARTLRGEMTVAEPNEAQQDTRPN